MAVKTRAIRIESILGGHSPTTHFAQLDQYQDSIGIDPSLPANGTTLGQYKMSGLIRPVTAALIGTSLQVPGNPYWLIKHPKLETIYLYDSSGSAHSIPGDALNALTALSDGGTLSSSSGNGAAYYDNYIYFAKNTDIARYGPLNGTPAFTGTYWTGTLSKTALVNTTYPTSTSGSAQPFSNHILHRHSDGRLYIGDVVGNQGVIHFIETTKTTVEGDTDNGSTYQKLTFGYGLWPTAMESYGSDLAIAFYEGSVGQSRDMVAKLAFWDTTSQNFNRITWVEFPDSIITALKNVNGTLYVISTNNIFGSGTVGFRVSRFVGGYSFQEVASIEYGEAPRAGAVDAIGERLFFGSSSSLVTGSCVYSIGLRKPINKGIFCPIRGTVAGVVTALTMASNGGLETRELPIFGIESAGGGTGTINKPSTTVANLSQTWRSQIYKIGQSFKITKIRIPFAQAIAASMIIVPKIYTDDESGTTYTLQTINNTNYSGKYNVVMRSDSSGNTIRGNNNFFLELTFNSTVLVTVGLPITIEYEIIDD